MSVVGSNLKVVATCSAGINHVDYEILKARGIKFGHTPGVVSGSVADIAVLLTLAAMRRLQEGRLQIEKSVHYIYFTSNTKLNSLVKIQKY